jgi:hypothetical protein
MVLPVGMAAAALQVKGSGTPSPMAHGRGHDAVWLGHGWVDGRRTGADVRDLAARLRATGIGDLFVHTGPLRLDGGLDPARHPRAAWMLKALHAALPGVRVQAWLGQKVDTGHLRLDDPVVRDRILGAARQVLDLGFDGVHYDLEPVPDGSPAFLDLLARTRALTGTRVLSVATPQVEPAPLIAAVGNPIIGHDKWWTPHYLTKVAHLADQVAVMSYDTALPLRTWYAGYVRMETETALRAVPPSTGLLIGLPAYRTDDMGHHASAETVAAAIRGARLGLGTSPRNTFGVALYADFTATDADWRTYHHHWLG